VVIMVVVMVIMMGGKTCSCGPSPCRIAFAPNTFSDGAVFKR